MGIFDGSNESKTAKGTEGGIFFLPGTYLAEVTRCKEGVNQHGKKFFVAEFKILESDHPERKVGTPCSFMVTFDKWPKLAMGNVCDFLRAGLSSKLAAVGVSVPFDKIDLDDDIGNNCVGEKNELVGVKLRLFAFNKLTKEGKDFTRHTWFLPSAQIGATDKAAALAAPSAA